MYESKSMFAKRIGKSIAYVSKMCAVGAFPVNDRGFVDVDASLLKYKNRRRVGRPRTEKLQRVVVRVRPGQVNKIKKMAYVLRKSD